jgi:hypothetical protein
MEEIQDKIQSLIDYRNALTQNDRAVFDRLVNYAKGHVNACGKANSLSVLESMLLAIVLEQQKTIENLRIANHA